MAILRNLSAPAFALMMLASASVGCDADSIDNTAGNGAGNGPDAMAAAGADAAPDDVPGEPDAAPEVQATMVADFSLVDVNETSPLFGQMVSPRDYLGEVSVWYLTHST